MPERTRRSRRRSLHNNRNADMPRRTRTAEERRLRANNVIKLPVKNINNNNSDKRLNKKKGEKNNSKNTKNNGVPIIQIDKRRLLYCAVAFCIVVFVIWGLTHKNAQAIFVDDVKVCVIQDMDITSEKIYNTAIAKLKSDIGVNVDVNEKISLKPVHTRKSDVVSTDYALAEICKNFTYQVEAAAIVINGVEYGISRSEETAHNLLNQILNKYPSKENNEIIDKNFVEKVDIVSKFVNNNELQSDEKILSILNSSLKEERKYKVKSGDTLWRIAYASDMTLEELLKINSGLTEKSVIKLGQELNIVVSVPLLSVKTTEKIVYSEVIPKTVETINNNSKSKTYKKVIQTGSDGRKEVTANVIYINGIQSSKEVVNENIIVEPVNEKIEVGTI